MKKQSIQATGTINQDGRLAMYMGEINDFFSQNKGKRIVASFSIAEPGSTQALRGYYFGYIVPTFQTALWESGERKTKEQTEQFLREISPIMHEEVVTPQCEYKVRMRGISELNNAELIEHIETLKQIAAEEYCIYIDDPTTI